MSFPIRNGSRYRAEIHLSGIESWASNATVRQKLEEAGFGRVVVKGYGGKRIAEGVWLGESVEDAVHLIPSQVYSVEEV